MVVLGIFLIAAITLCVTWYCVAMRQKQRKAREVLRWIQSALAGRGQVIGISWTGAAKFRVPLGLPCGIFPKAWGLGGKQSEQPPLRWLFNKLRKQRELVTFQADLDLPPAFSLHVHNFRWVARSSRRTPENRAGWNFECLQPLIISTRPEQQKEIACAMASLTRSDTSEFLNVSFQRSSPHFSAQISQKSVEKSAERRTYGTH